MKKGKKVIPFNLDLVLQKKGIANTTLKVDDAVRIYSKDEIKGTTQYVSIDGHVKNPGIYELFENNMTLYDLIFKAGGFQDDLHRASTFLERADLIRYDEDRITKSIVPFNLGQVLADRSSDQNFKLVSGDFVRIYPIEVFNSVRPVSISGVIRNPGQYELKTGMTIKDLILEAGGVTTDVFRYKLEVSRIDPNNTDQFVYSDIINLDMLSDYSISNIDYKLKSNSNNIILERDGFKLNPYDYVSVRPDPFFQIQQTISIEGAVLYPGVYSIVGPDERLSDVVLRAGSLRLNAYPEKSTFIRSGNQINLNMEKILSNSKSKENIKVRDGDRLIIGKKSEMVQISGEVNVPGYYKFIKGNRVKDLILKAGGFTGDEDDENIFIIYPNGTSAQYGPFFKDAKLKDSAHVIKSRKKDEEPVDKTEVVKEFTEIFANLVQILSIIIIAKN